MHVGHAEMVQQIQCTESSTDVLDLSQRKPHTHFIPILTLNYFHLLLTCCNFLTEQHCQPQKWLLPGKDSALSSSPFFTTNRQFTRRVGKLHCAEENLGNYQERFKKIEPSLSCSHKGNQGCEASLQQKEQQLPCSIIVASMWKCYKQNQCIAESAWNNKTQP